MDVTADDVKSQLVILGWDRSDFSAYERGQHVTVALGLDLIGTSASSGGNAASGLINDLVSAGFSVEPNNWQHLLNGGEAIVTRKVV